MPKCASASKWSMKSTLIQPRTRLRKLHCLILTKAPGETALWVTNIPRCFLRFWPSSRRGLNVCRCLFAVCLFDLSESAWHYCSAASPWQFDKSETSGWKLTDSEFCDILRLHGLSYMHWIGRSHCEANRTESFFLWAAWHWLCSRFEQRPARRLETGLPVPMSGSVDRSWPHDLREVKTFHGLLFFSWWAGT